MSDEHKNCLTETAKTAGLGAVFGTIAGATIANWGDVPKVIRNKSLPALKETGVRIWQKTTLFTIIGAAFQAGQCTTQTLRGKHDIWDNVAGAYAVGAVFGVRTKAMSVAIGSGTFLAVLASAVYLTGGKFKGEGLFKDGLTPPPPQSSYPRGPIEYASDEQKPF